MEKQLLSYYKVKEIRKKVYRIFSPEQVHVELFVGEKAALLLDTGYGLNHLCECVREITHLPLFVVNSHGHPDHSGGNFQFQEDIYIHPLDIELCKECNSVINRKKNVESSKHVIQYGTETEQNILPEGFDEDAYVTGGWGHLVPVEEGHVFELGGITLRVIDIPGHTKGSIGLLFEEEKIFYSGDGINSFLWLFMPEATNLSTYENTLRKALRLDFEKLIFAHHPAEFDKAVINDYLDCATGLDYLKGYPFESSIAKGVNAKVCTRAGFTLKDVEKPGFASIVISESHLQ